MPCRIRHVALLAALCVAVGGGCETTVAGPRAELPVNAQGIIEKAGGFAFQAPRDGTALIVDKLTGRLVYQAPLKFNQWLFFNPEKKRIIVGGQIITRQDLDADRIHRLYFAGG